MYDAFGAGSNSDVKRAEEAAEVFGAVMNQMAQDASSMQSDESVVADTESVSADMDSAKRSYEYSAREHRIEEASEKDVDLPEESVVNEVKELTEDAVELICEKLNISKEDLFQKMQSLGISEVELFQPEKLAQLVMELTGESNVFNLLTNADFQSILQELSAMEKEAAASFGMNLEQFKEVVQDVLHNTQQNETQQIVTDNKESGVEQMVGSAVSENMESGTGAVQAAGNEETITNAQSEGDNSTVTKEQAEKKITANGQGEKVNQELTNNEASQKVEENLVDETEGFEEELKLQEDSKNQMTVNQDETSSEEMLTQKMKSSQQEEHQDNSSFENRNQQFNDGISTGANFTSEISANGIVEESFTEISYSNIDVDDLMQQFVENIRIAILENKTTMDMQLNPENLGKIYLHLTAEEGAVQAQIIATNESVKEALESQMAALRENLNQAGVKVESVEISVATHEFEQNLEQNNKQGEQQGEMQEELSKTRRNINLNSLDELAGVMSEEEVLVAQMMRDNGNSVDFTA